MLSLIGEFLPRCWFVRSSFNIPLFMPFLPCNKAWPQGKKNFLHAQLLSMKFKLLIYTVVAKINGIFRFKSPFEANCLQFNLL